jgi:hypothetical protein
MGSMIGWPLMGLAGTRCCASCGSNVDSTTHRASNRPYCALALTFRRSDHSRLCFAKMRSFLEAACYDIC